MGTGGADALAVWASTAWSLCEGRLGDNKSCVKTKYAEYEECAEYAECTEYT
jgi:hypothetical protein